MSEGLTVLAAVVLGAVLTSAQVFWTNHRGRKKKAAYLAVLVSATFDRFVDGCVAVIGDDGLLQGQRHPDGQLYSQVDHPELDFQSLNVEWQSLSTDLMYEILNFENRVESANKKIDSVRYYVAHAPDYEEYYEERQYQFATLGIDAANLAERLCEKYDFPRRDYEDWNPIEYMEEDLEKTLKVREERDRRHQAASKAIGKQAE